MAVDPSTLRILLYPERILRLRAADIPAVTDEVRAVAERMIELMREAQGIGLAAPQVGLPWRMFVADVPPTEDRSHLADPPTATPGPQVYINPEFTERRDPVEPSEEGCLSLPDIRGDVVRPAIVTISALDLVGRRFTQSAGGLLGRCWQHEYDHLDGVLIIDRMTQLSRLKNRTAVRELERAGR